MTRSAAVPDADFTRDPARVLRFEGVELRQEDYRLRVDGRQRVCSRKTFELLWALARQPGRVRSREALTAELWPGGQIISDEALTQLVYRARNALGRYGASIRTVRGVGFALDAEVSREPIAAGAGDALSLALVPRQTAVYPEGPDPDPAWPTEPSSDPSPASAAACSETVDDLAVPAPGVPERLSGIDVPEVRARPAARPDPGIALIAVLAVLALLAAWYWRSADATGLDLADGYGFTLADLDPSRRETPRLFAEGLAVDAAGDRGRARALMRGAHDSDPQSALPALMLTLWAAAANDQPEAAHWSRQAALRIRSDSTPLLRLFRDYVEAERGGDGQQVVASAGALLSLRPEAWRMRHARAHLLEYRGVREAALEELRAVRIGRLGHRKRDQVIADLASFGDPEAATRILEQLAGDPDQAAWHFLAARVAWSREDWTAVIRATQTSRMASLRQARVDLQWRTLFLESAALVLLQRDEEAIAAAEHARSLMGSGNPIDEIDLSVLLAELRAERGESARLAEELQRIRTLLRQTTSGDSRVSAWLMLLRRAALAEDEGPALASGSAQRALWDATRRAQAGDALGARELLAVSIQRGIAATRLWDDARHLQAWLGLPVGEARPLDPPFPPLARVVLRRSLISEPGAALPDTRSTAPRP